MSRELIWYLAGHLVCISQWAAFILVMAACLGRGERFRHPGLWSALLAAGFLFLSIRFDFGFFNLRSVLSNVVYLFLAVCFFGGTWPQKLMACLINGIMCLLTENTVSYCYAGVKDVPTGAIWRSVGCLTALVAANIAVGILVAWFVRRWKRERALEPLQIVVMSFFPCIVVGLNIVLMIFASDQEPSLLNILLTLGLTVAVLVHLAIAQMFNDQMRQQQELQIQAVREKENAEALLESYTIQRRLTHEFTNHMDALALLLQQNDYEGAKAYLASLTNVVASNTTIMNTHNPLLDALLTKKYEDASAKGVMLYFDLPDLRELPMDKTDLVLVVSNLLNNAIEAAAQANPPEIYLRMRKTEEELLLSVRNRVQKNVELAEGQLPRSTKQEPGHGIGLRNVRDVLEKYGGEYTISCRDCWFRFTGTVPVCKRPQNMT